MSKINLGLQTDEFDVQDKSWTPDSGRIWTPDEFGGVQFILSFSFSSYNINSS
jgi:hypothetical protein